MRQSEYRKRRRKKRPKRVKISNKHAAGRLVRRYSGRISIQELEQAALDGKAECLVKQTNTRSLRRYKGVYFIWSRRFKSVVTVLTLRQAEEQLKSYGYTEEE